MTTAAKLTPRPVVMSDFAHTATASLAGGFWDLPDKGFYVLPVPVNFRVSPKHPVPDWASGWSAAEELRKCKGTTSVAQTEYDFSGVPDNEISSCMYYEYARECAEMCVAVENLREQLLESTKGGVSVGMNLKIKLHYKKITKIPGMMYESMFLLKLSGCAEFPRVGWQCLNAQDKKQVLGLQEAAMREHNKETARKHPVLITDSGDVGGLDAKTLGGWTAEKMPANYRKLSPEQLRRYLLPGFMMVNLLYDPDQIVAEFKKWLLKRHPKGGEPRKERRGRNSLRDKLNALGAMRLRFYCRTLTEAQGVTAGLRGKEHGLYYNDRTAWNRACGRAAEYFREVLELPDADFPIHYSKGWQK